MRVLVNSVVRAAATAALAVALGAPGAWAQSPKTLKFIPQADLRSIDPVWTTAYITRNHGYMVYDTLFAVDKELAPHPQMVDTFTISPDKLTYSFKLRDGLKWHDGAPVRAADCIASLKRWAKRHPLGQNLERAGADGKAADDN